VKDSFPDLFSKRNTVFQTLKKRLENSVAAAAATAAIII
jgi:hypothetical protein